jgi:hypothetical protein
MIGREEAIEIAQKLSVDDPQGGPIERVGDVFTRDGGLTWMAHLWPVPPDLGEGVSVVDTPGTCPVCVCGQTGRARWVETL